MRQLRLLLMVALLFGLFIIMPDRTHADSIRVVLDGQELAFEVAPMIEDGRTLVPLRAILTPLGATFSWDEPSRTVTAEVAGTEVRLTLDKWLATVNGEVVALDTPAKSVDGRTLVPLRFFAESFGFRVGWDEESRTVAISSRGGSVAARGAGLRSAGNSMATLGRSLVGRPYSWGGTGPYSFDCSGFVTYVTSEFGFDLPRTSHEMFWVGTPVLRNELQAGDLVFFSTYDDGASHVGVYLGDGTFVHSESEWTGVKITEMDRAWWAARYLGARRLTP